MELGPRVEAGVSCNNNGFFRNGSSYLGSLSSDLPRIRAWQRKCSCGSNFPIDKHEEGWWCSGKPASHRDGARHKGRCRSHTGLDECMPKGVSVASRSLLSAVDHRNSVGFTRSGAPWLPLLACYTAVLRGGIVRRCTPCRRPEIPSKLTQKRRPDHFGLPSQYLSVYSTKSIGCTLVRKLCTIPTCLQSLRRIGGSGEEIFDRKSVGEAQSHPSSSAPAAGCAGKESAAPRRGDSKTVGCGWIERTTFNVGGADGGNPRRGRMDQSARGVGLSSSTCRRHNLSTASSATTSTHHQRTALLIGAPELALSFLIEARVLL
jgi:hypothetical protein